MKALIIGATGATGKDLIPLLLADATYTEVVAFVRKSSEIKHPKLSEFITDFDKLEEVSEHIKGDVLFSLLGTTLKAAGSKEKQQHIDLEIPVKFAELAKQSGVKTAVLLSAYGASATSNVFYSRMKGKLENAIITLGFTACIIFRPGLLVRKGTDRPGERSSEALLKFLNKLGILKKFRPLPTEVLAEKLAEAPKVLSEGQHIISLDQIFKF